MEKETLTPDPIQVSETSPIINRDKAFEDWTNSLSGNIVASDLPAPKLFSNASNGESHTNPNKLSFDEVINRANTSNVLDTSKGVYSTKDINFKRYDKGVKLGIDNEELYANNQTLGEKAYNGVVKMTGIAATTFVNGTAGLVYGILKSSETGDVSSFYNNDLSNYLNNVNTEMEDTYAHFKTERERSGDWWEPSNLFTANFLFDNIIKNLGFSLGAAASGFAWGGALNAIGLTGKLVGAGAKMAAQADTIVSEAAALPQLERLATINSKLSNLWNGTKSAVGKGLMKSDQAIVATFGTFGEAGIEALSNSRQFRQEMIDQFKYTHGYAPEGADLEGINNDAESVGNWSFALNTALLTATNYIQLPKIYASSFKSEKGILNNITLQGEKYASTLPEKGFGKLMYKTKNVASLFFNTAEGFEEGAQYAIQTGTQNYYNNKYKGKERSILDDGILYGIKEALTTGEGTLNIFTGAFSGALQSSGFVGIKKNEANKYRPTIGGTGKIGERGLTGYGGKQAVERTEAVNALNNSMIKNKMKDAYSNIKAAEAIQQDREAAIRQGDILESKDLEFDYAHNFITTRLKYNAKSAIDNEIADLKEQALTDDGFLKLQQQGTATDLDTKESFTNRLTNLKQHADSAAKMYEATEIKYKGLIDKETGQRLYTDDVIDKLVYAGSKVLDYDKRIPQLNIPLAQAGITTLDILNDILTTGTPKEEAVAKAIADIKALKTTNEDELITNLRDIVEVSLRRVKFIDEYNDIKNNPKNNKEPLLDEEEQSSELLLLTEGNKLDAEGNVVDSQGNIVSKPTIKLKTKAGERNIEIGTEYFLGRRTFYSKDGKEVYRVPTLTILGENEDGTIKIKDAKGDIRDISKEELEDYKLAKVSSTLKNKVAKYYLEHMNSVFEFYGKKITNAEGKRVPVRGRLEYEETDNGLKDKIFFVYKDEKGNIVRKEIDGSMVVPKDKKYKHAILKHIGDLSPAQEKAEADFGKTTSASVQAKLQRREDVLNELYEEVLGKKENTEKLISEKNDKLEKLRKQITDVTDQIETNKNPQDKRFKKFTLKETIFDAISQLKELSKMEQDLQQELEELYTVDDELKLNVEYVEQLIDSMEELPTSTKEFIDELNDELIDLNILVEETGKQINTVSSLMDATRDAIKSAIKYLSGLIKNFESRYFNVPSPQGQQWVDFLQANPNFLKAKPNYKAEFNALEEIIATTEDFNITPNESRLEDLEEHLEILQGALKDYEKQIKVREDVLNKLEDVYKKHQEQKQQEKELADNQQLLQEFIGTLDNSMQPISSITDDEKVYEQDARKSDYNVLGGTRPISNKRPHNMRANRFGSRFNSLSKSKKENIKGRIVTFKTEELQGVPGMSNLIVDGEADPKDVIALVMVIMNENGTYSLVDEFGNAFTDEQKQKPLEHAVFQVFPGDSLQGQYSGKTESMFRDATAEGRKEIIGELTKQYRDWRKQQLAKDDLEYPKDFKASFGIPEYVTMLVEKKVGDQTIQVEEINYNATTPVEKTGLVSKTDLSNKKVITFSTSDTVSEGSVTFKTKPGRVFLSLPGGLVKLNNRKLNQDEATRVYESIYQLSKIAFDKGTIKDNDEAQQIVRWLKSIVYWGIAKNTQTKERKQAGYNNIWFEDIADEKGNKSTRLFISGLGGNMSFAPTELANRRNELITLISSLYHNVSGTQVNNNAWSVPYTEIMGFDKSGEAITREWKNYQTYLLSSEGRTETEIPLTTIIRPQQGEDDVVKKGVYFVLNETADTFNFQAAKPKPVVQKETAPVAQQPAAAKPTTPSGVINVNENSASSMFKLDGKTTHRFETKLGFVNVLVKEDGSIDFANKTIDKDGYIEITDDETNNTIDALVERGLDPISTIIGKVEDVTKPIAIANSIPQDNAVTAAPVVEAPVAQPAVPVSDIEAKEVDIEKTKTENIQLGQSILQQAGYKNENRLPNNNVKGGQSGWKIRFNIKNPKTGNSYYDDGKSTLVDDEYNKRSETLVNFLLNYFGSNEKADSKNLEKHYILEDKDGTKREPFKHLSGGEIGESDFTIYIGSADDVMKFISDIRTKHPEILELLHQGNTSGDISIDDIFKGRIEGSKIGFSGYHVPTNLNKVTGSNDFVFIHNGNRVAINYAGTSLIDISVISEETGKGYKGVFDKNMEKDLPELYKNIRNIIGFQLYGKYLTGSNNEFAKLTGTNNEELVTVEETKPVEEAPVTTANPFANRRKTNGVEDIDKTAYRLELYKQFRQFTPENFNKLEQFLKEKFPNIPVYRVKNAIKTSNGRQAWGMFHKGAIYLYENAEIGTGYHEVFEAVWAMMTSPSERINVAKDFRNREGSYVDRFTGETVVYKDATDDEMREELAEEFRDYVLYDKNPQQAPKPKTPSFLRKIFDEIINAIKAFFVGNDAAKNTQELFDKIGNGYYKTYIPYEQKLSFANVGYTDITEVIPDSSSTFRLENLSATDIHQIMQQMTYTTITQMTGNNQSLFNITSMDRKKMYNIVKDDLLDGRIGAMADQVVLDIKNGKITQEQGDSYYNNLGTLYNNVANQWPSIQEKHEEYLQSYGIVFDENDEINYDDYEKSKDEGYGDPRQIDGFKKLNNTIKLLLSSLSESSFENNTSVSRINNIGGVTLVPLGSVYVDLLNQLHNSVDQSDMINKFRKASRNNPNYVSLFERMFKVNPLSENPIDYSLLSKEDLRLIDGFWKTFKKQSPTVSALFILGNGDIVVGDSNTSGAVREYRRKFINSILESSRTGTNPYITKDKTKGFVATESLKALNEQSDIAKLVSFLSNLGIQFSEKELKKANSDIQKMFREASNGIIKSLKQRVTDKGIERINVNTLDISGRLLELGLVKSKLETSEFETTYFNINGERSQTFLGPNILSSFYDVISKVEKISELADTNFGYLITDTYSNIGSVMLNRIFDENGNKREGISLETLKPFIIDGTINEETGRNTESSRLTKRQRYLQELNMNLKGIYMNLIPGDANMQTAIKLHDSDNPFVTKDMLLSKGYINIFKNQLLSEITMSREENRQVAKNRNNQDLRFYKYILGDVLNKKIVNKAQSTNVSAEEIYNDFEKEIKDKIEEFINNKTDKSLQKMKEYNIIKPSAEGNYNVENISIFNSDESYTIDAIRSAIKQQQMNFMIANTELHKLIYSDPYQYSDQLKRVKNFSSPRQILSYGNNEINSRYGELYNNDDSSDELFNTDFNRDTINGATISDILSDNEELGYDPFEETDGGGIITDKGLRYTKIKNGEWTPENEEQYIYDMAYMKRVLNKPLNAIEKERFKNGNPIEQSNYTPIKPIVAGNKNMGRSYNDLVLDKFSLFPISFRMIHELNPTANMLKLYEKMIADDVDYAVYASGRKVGKENIYQLYDKKGNFNTAPLISAEEKKNPLGKQTVLKIPLSIFAIQTEVPTKEDNKVTQGSQPTKLATMDYMQAGVPIDFMAEEKDFTTRYNEWIKLLDKGSYNNGDNLYNELKNNQNLLEARIQDGLTSLFKELGITKVGKDDYKLSNPKLTFDILKKELLKREINDNIVDALNGYEDGKFVLEAIPSYQQIRNILYSIAHRAVVSTKIKGGQKVQVSSALLESQRAEAREVVDSQGNTKTVYQSDILRFYTNADGKRTCQIMISRWFKSPLSDKELLNYFNNTEEGKKQLAALAGVAFRIPTQKQNSIEVFEIAKFLPEGFGDSVIVPSALVMKVGSDFDIDKLFIYLKNLYTSKDKKLKVVPYFGIGKEAIAKFGELYDKGEFDEYIKSKKDLISREDAEGRMMSAIFAEEVGAGGRIDVINTLYRQSLDNAYIDSLEKLVSHPLNFKNLVKPNSAEQLQTLTIKIEDLLGSKKIDYSNVGEMLDREFMSELRNDFVRAKSAIGIAATSQTGNAQAQRGLLTIDRTRLKRVSEKDRAFLGDVSINFQNYNSVKGMPTLSMIEDANALPEDRNYISDVIGQVIDGYVDAAKDPWVMRLGITPNVAGTWLFLIRTGVPLNDIAYFMNQPIIKEFLQTLENNGYSYVFNSKYINAVKEAYEYEAIASESLEISTIPNATDLSKMIGKDETTLSPYQSLQQLFILDEFLKYSKMAEQLLTFTQATNFDTATFNDPFLIAKKLRQIEKARNTIFSDVDLFLDSSFIGELKDALNSFRDGIAEILLSDKRENPNGQSIRSVLEQVLDPYMDMNDKDFVSISRKAVLTLFDWAVQTNTKLNTQITKVLLSNDKGESTASELMKLKRDAENPEHRLYNNYVLKSLELEKGNSETEPDNLYINAKATKVYDQNQIIYALREIKKLLPESQKALYGNLVRLAVIQSGLSNSRIAFTNLLPFDDFVAVYNDTLSKIDKLPNLSDFVDMNVFERENWNDSNIVDQHKERVILTKNGRYFKPETTMVSKKLGDAMLMGEIPKTINISANSMEANSDVITFIWSDMTVNKDKKREMAKRGDYSFMKKGLFKKVYSKTKKGISSPIVYETVSKDKKTKKTTVYKNYVYKMINAWGDSLYAKEFYGKTYPEIATSTVSRPSVFDNGYEKVEVKAKVTVLGDTVITKGEVEDSVIVEILGSSAYVEGDEFIFASEEESLSSQEQNSPEGLPSINRTNKKC